MTDETKDQTKNAGGICPSCGKEQKATNHEANSLPGICPRCGKSRGEDGAGRSCSCSKTGGG